MEDGMIVMDAVAPRGAAEVEETIRQEVARIAGVRAADIRPDRTIVEYGIDSLRAMELVVSLEEAFGVSIPDDCLATMTTLKQVTAFVTAKLEER
jgi:acyl carrier protein